MVGPISKSGRRAHAPRWWGSLLSLIPQVTLPWLEPEQWTKELAEVWVKKIPPKCPFERQLWVSDTLILYVPPLCPLNPISKQLYQIRLRAQTYLLYHER